MVLIADSLLSIQRRSITGGVTSKAVWVEAAVTFSFTLCSKIGRVQRMMAWEEGGQPEVSGGL